MPKVKHSGNLLKWDAEHNSFNKVDPVTLLNSFMQEQNMKATHLVKLLGVSKGYVSEISLIYLHYQPFG